LFDHPARPVFANYTCSLDLEIGDKYKEVAYRSKSTMTVTCKIAEDSSLVHLSWMKGNKKVQNEGSRNGSKVYVRDKGNVSELIFDGPAGVDTGKYTCNGHVVRSQFDATIKSKSVYVQVINQPVKVPFLFIYPAKDCFDSRDFKDAVLGEQLEIPCGGNRTFEKGNVTVSWYFGDKILKTLQRDEDILENGTDPREPRQAEAEGGELGGERGKQEGYFWKILVLRRSMNASWSGMYTCRASADPLYNMSSDRNIFFNYSCWVPPLSVATSMMATNSTFSPNSSTSYLPASSSSTNFPLSSEDTINSSVYSLTTSSSSNIMVYERPVNNAPVIATVVTVVITGVVVLVALTVWLRHRRSHLVYDLSNDQKDIVRSCPPLTPDIDAVKSPIASEISSTDQIRKLADALKPPRRSSGLRILKFDGYWDIDRSSLEIQEELGSGCFGVVRKALFHNAESKQDPIPVAVKMVENMNNHIAMKALETEAMVMKKVGAKRHPHIVNLIGLCTQHGPLMVVVEYAENGCLLTYLRQHRETHNYNKVALTKSTSGESYKSTHSNAGKCPGTLSESQMIDYGMQIAEGMKYLASQECIHCDLATRNILVCQGELLKVADFGLAKDIHYLNGYYRKQTKQVHGSPEKQTSTQTYIPGS
jgi:hypothetical protein